MTATKTKTALKKPATKKPAAAKTAKAKAPAAAKKPAASKAAAPKNPKMLKPVKAAAKPAPAARKAKPAVVNAPQSVVVGPAMRKKEVVEAVVARSGLKKRDVKPVVEHLLAVLGDAISDGHELVLPPLGRLKVHKKKDGAKKTIFFAKIHRNVQPALGVADLDGDKGD